MKLLKYIILLLLLMSFIMTFGQQPKRIRLVSAELMAYDKNISSEVQRVIGNVIFEHDSAYMYCDSAYINNVSNSLKAYRNVRVKVSDTLNLYGDSLHYEGTTKIANIYGKVKLIDNKTVLTTKHLIFDRNTNIAFFDKKGHIINEINTLNSEKGYYYTNVKEFFFKDSIILSNKDYKMYSDTLHYNTNTKISTFLGPTNIIGKESKLYSERGWYNTETDVAIFKQNASLKNGSQQLIGDSIYYEKINEFGKAYCNVVFTDTTENVVLLGDLGEYSKSMGYAYITENAEVQLIDKNDTLFMHSNIIFLTFDSLQNNKDLFAYYKVKFFNIDIQGKCDSLYYSFIDSTMRLRIDPIVWSDKNQITADSINITNVNGKIDKLYMFNNSFIISNDTISNFNQIKGRDMISYFTDNELYKIDVSGNAETIYWVRDDKKTLIGLNKSKSSNLKIELLNKNIEKIIYIETPEAILYPEDEIEKNIETLDGFKWLESSRPLSRSDIFIQ